MADDLDTPPIAPPEPAPSPVVEPPADPDEAIAVEIQGGKHVPLSALHAVRAENKALKEKASQADTLASQLAHLQGQLAGYQQVQHHLRPTAGASASPAVPDVDPDLLELARQLDYYKADGSPDLDRAAKHDQLIQRRAEKIARTLVAPIAQSAADERSARNFLAAAQEKLPDGRPIDPQWLASLWRSMPAEQTADPRVARILVNNVLAEQLRAGQTGAPLPAPIAPPGTPPVHTANLGRTPERGSKPLSEVERAVIDGRGMTESKYQELTKNFRPGRVNILEE